MLFQGTTTRDHTAINQRAAELGGDHDASTKLRRSQRDVSSVERGCPGGTRVDRRSGTPLHGAGGPARERATGGRAGDPWPSRRRRELRRGRDLGKVFPGRSAGFSPSGTLASVRSITASDVRRFLRRRLVGRNLVLSIVGDPPLGEVRRVLTEEFASLPAGSPCVANGARIARRGEIRLRRSGLTQLYWTTLFAVPARRRELSRSGSLSRSSALIRTAGSITRFARGMVSHTISGRIFRVARNGRRSWSGQAERRAEYRLRAAIDAVFAEAAEKGFATAEIAEHDETFGTDTRGSRSPRSTEPLRMPQQFSTVLPAWTRPKRWCARWRARRSRPRGAPRCALRASPEF